MKHTSIVRTAASAALVVVIAGCGGGSSPAASRDSTGGSSSSSQAPNTTTAGGGSGRGTFRTGHATTVTPSETIKLDLDSGSFVKALGAHGSVSVNWTDGADNLVNLFGDGNGGYKLSVIGRAAPNGITQNDCTATVTKDQPSGVEGTYTCAGGITGTLAAQ
jgi:hypothetical protein